MINRSVVTVAVGKPYYLGLAQNLLNSFLLWNKDNDITFLLLTDNADHYTAYTNDPRVKIKFIELSDNDKSFTSKFLLFDHCIARQNLFIDCDCLVYKNLNFVFDAFKSKSFSAIGNTITTGNFFCDVKTTLDRFAINAMPKFVGSVYYFKNDAKAKEIFETAINLKKSYDENGFIRLRGKENEEPLFAVAMALNSETLLANNGSIKADLMYYKTVRSNILTGNAVVKHPIHAITGGETVPNQASPAILHFNGSFTDTYHYQVEIYRMANQNKSLVNLIAWSYYIAPNLMKHQLKSILRPLYHKLFGARKISNNKRV